MNLARVAIMMCFAWLFLALLAAEGVSPADGSLSEPPEISIRVLPRRVYPSIVYALQLTATGLKADKRYWSWSATGGEIIGSGAPEVYWKSPSSCGKVRITAVALREDGTESDLGGNVEVEVARPSTEGMVYVPPGIFVMGDIWTDTSDSRFIPTFENLTDKPPHRVYLDGYWIDRDKVTNKQYADFLNDSLQQGLIEILPDAVVGRFEGAEFPFYLFELKKPRRPPARMPKLARALYWDGSAIRVKEGREEHPVMDVTWQGAKAYALFRGKRLPTEAEWEKAARGTDGRKFPWGDELPTKYHANVNAYYGTDYLPVGSFSPTGDSPYGLCDVLGGFEWIEDWFDSYYYWDNYSELPLENPKGPQWGFDRTVRGTAIHTSVYGTEPQSFTAPLSFRYQWEFEFGYGHLFAHADTGIRTALSPDPCGKESRSPGDSSVKESNGSHSGS